MPKNTVSDGWRYKAESSRVVRSVNAARKFGKFTDVTFVVGPDGNACVIKAHRAVLATGNAEFSRLLYDSCDSEPIRIPDVSPKGFKNLIRYLYDVSVKFKDLSTIRETLVAAEKFKVHKLKLAAENYLKHSIQSENDVLEFLQFALQFDMPKLENKCIENVSSMYRKLMTSQSLFMSSFEVIETVLSERPCIGEECQHLALLAIGKWKKLHEESTLDDFKALLSCIDFTRLKIGHFDDFLEKNGKILSDEDVKAFRDCILTMDVKKAPLWYQAPDEFLEDCCSKTRDAKEPAEEVCSETRNAKEPAEEVCSETRDTEESPEEIDSESKFSREKKKQLALVKAALNDEIRYVKDMMRESAETSLELTRSVMNETIDLITSYIENVLVEAVDTSIESFENDVLNAPYAEEIEKNEDVKDMPASQAKCIDTPEVKQSTDSETKCSVEVGKAVPSFDLVAHVSTPPQVVSH